MQRDTGCEVLEDQGLEDVQVGLSELSDMLRSKDQGTTTQHIIGHIHYSFSQQSFIAHLVSVKH